MMKNMSGGKGIHRSFRPDHSRTWIHSPALHFGLCWYHVGLSALAHGIGKLAPKERLDTSIETSAPKVRPDISIAQRAMK